MSEDSNSKVIVVFINRFPYSTGEFFFGPELIYIKEKFKNIYIIPMFPDNINEMETYDGVKILNISLTDCTSPFRAFIKNPGIIIKYIFNEIFFSKYRFYFLRDLKNNYVHLINVVHKAKQLIAIMNKNDIASATVYCYWANEHFSISAMMKNLKYNCRIVTRMHGYDFDPEQRKSDYFPFREQELKLAEKVVQISEYGYNKTKNMYPKIRNLYVSKLGVPDNGSSKIATHDTPYQIVSCSGFVELKRIPLLIEILSRLKSSYTWTHFGKSAGFEECYELAQNRLPPHSFKFMGYVDNVDLMDYYKSNAIDLFINTSRLEGLPVSMMEAISFGIPICGFNICGIPEIVNDKTGILLSNANDIDVSARNIDQFLTQNSRSINFRRGVKEFWNESFNSENNLNHFHQTFLSNTSLCQPNA